MLLLLLVPAALLFGQGRGGRLFVLEDGETPRQNRIVNDVKHVSFEVQGEVVEVTVTFRKTFPEMMFQAAEIYFDCDENPATGIGGAELRVRASVGSRFHANSWKQAGSGIRPPLSQRRMGYTTLDSYRAGAETEERKVWIWRGILDPPTVDGEKMRFAVPLRLIRGAGQRYNRYVPLWMNVEGSCSEDPIPLRHLVTDEGVGIVIDGACGDWSGGTRALDETGELHPDASALDIRKVQVDHGPEKLMVGIWLARAGFGNPDVRLDPDIRDQDRITVSVEPLGGQYLGFKRYVLHTTSRVMRGRDWRATAGDRFVEFAIRRPAAQTAFRVIVWADAIRVDRVPDEGTFRLDMKAGRRK